MVLTKIDNSTLERVYRLVDVMNMINLVPIGDRCDAVGNRWCDTMWCDAMQYSDMISRFYAIGMLSAESFTMLNEKCDK